jgi:hypothetical protein
MDGTLEAHSLPIRDHPTTFILFNLEPARILFGAPEFQPATYSTKIWMGGLTQDELRQIKEKYGGRGFAAGGFETRSFVRMIAKISHSYAVAYHGLGTFDPLLTKMIRGEPYSIGHLVGGHGEDEPAEPLAHTISLQQKVVGHDRFLVAFVRLFANLGAPRYHAVVGRIPPGSPIIRPAGNQPRP